MEYLEQYVPELKIEYHAGRLNRADSLTRPPQLQLTTIGSVTWDESFIKRFTKGYRLICVPAERKLRHLLLRKHHDQNGHSGVDKTLGAISSSFFWPKLSQDVRSYVRSCHTCQCNKARNVASCGLLHPLETPQLQWTHVTLGFITDLPCTSSHHNAILTMAHFLPTSTTATAENVADLFFKEVVRLHGIPPVLISDHDSWFVGRFWQSLFNRLGTKIRLSTAYHPRSNGQTERMN
ncbi:unnamed protein product [Closterium sp. NIES-54]